MTKEELVALGLTEEQITEVFKLNGIAVNNAKGDTETLKTELASIKEQLTSANTEIESYKTMDIEGIKQSANDYKAKFEQAQQKSQEEINNLKFEHSLENALNKATAKNVKAAKALLNIEELRQSKNIDKDIETAINTLKESEGYLFGVEDPLGTGGSLGAGGRGTVKGLTKEEFDKMNYKERTKLYSENPTLYNDLAK